MECGYCGNPIGMVTGLRHRGFCSPRHHDLWQMREWLASRGPARFQSQPGGPLDRAGEARTARVPFGRRMACPASPPQLCHGLFPAGPRIPVVGSSDWPCERRAHSAATWPAEPQCPPRGLRALGNPRCPEGRFRPVEGPRRRGEGRVSPLATLDATPPALAGLSKLESKARGSRPALRNCGHWRETPRQSIALPSPAGTSHGFRLPGPALPGLPPDLGVSPRLPAMSPSAWRPGDSGGWNCGPGGPRSIPAPAEFGLQTAPAHPRREDRPRAAMPFAGMFWRPLEQRCGLLLPDPSRDDIRFTAPRIQVPSFRTLRREPISFWPASSDGRLAQIECWPAPVLSAPPAISFTESPARASRPARPSDNVVVMPAPACAFSAKRGSGGARAAEYLPPSMAFRDFRPEPQRVRAVPVFRVEPCEFPPDRALAGEVARI